MAEPTKKSPDIEKLINSISGSNRVFCIGENICTWCSEPATEFRNEISRHEYLISGFCQKCQDETFGPD
jgi:Fe2+ or Zn2+ uptake regulation protein